MMPGPHQKIHLTDLEQNITFAGFFTSYKEERDNVIATMRDIEVYDYSSSAPLFSLRETTFKKSKGKIYMEAVTSCCVNS
ncbi:hypothetical protein MTO98_12390 [Mucilaginibacter sp. SMC90]|uniref:hypothetical protein n=1 Tax=Mucilaginibacter sp. SMC90 TaxID=2929803 RepID=UPI001FB54695|nr:hypothetical protein [Mucilaginibacter sp. SMC90]UOE51878.1 hypothetical protein MTO98_12390 [Mucilaginibacter sp. SMC90]